VSVERTITLSGGTPSGPSKRNYKTYILRCGDFIKIGKAVDVAKRIANLSTGNPEEIVLLHVFPTNVEKTLHRRFAHLRINGEWFRSSEGLEDFIDRARRGEI
jgi:hypothetical protein